MLLTAGSRCRAGGAPGAEAFAFDAAGHRSVLLPGRNGGCCHPGGVFGGEGCRVTVFINLTIRSVPFYEDTQTGPPPRFGRGWAEVMYLGVTEEPVVFVIMTRKNAGNKGLLGSCPPVIAP